MLSADDFKIFITSLSGVLWVFLWSSIIIDFFSSGRRLNRWSFILSTLLVLVGFGPWWTQIISLTGWLTLIALSLQKEKLKNPLRVSHSVLQMIIFIFSILTLTGVFIHGSEAFIRQSYGLQIFQMNRWTLWLLELEILVLSLFSSWKIRNLKSGLSSFVVFISFIVISMSFYQALYFEPTQVIRLNPTPITFETEVIFLSSLKSLALISIIYVVLFVKKLSLDTKPSFYLRWLTRATTSAVLLALAWFIVMGIQSWILFKNQPLPELNSSYTVKPEMIGYLVAQEDPVFFEHHGVSLSLIEWIINENFKYKKLVFGGSSITMQLAKLVYLSSERTLSRKARQMWLAWFLELKYDKDTILRYYLENVNFNLIPRGLEHAALTYFNKKPVELDLEEYGLLMRGLKNTKNFKSDPLTQEMNKWMIKGIHQNYVINMARFIDPYLQQLSLVEKNQEN